MSLYSTSIVDYIIIGAYMLIILGVGFFFTVRKETAENYLLGGRNMPYIAVGLSMMMSLLSSISIVQIPGEIYNFGWTLFSLHIFGILLQIPACYLFIRFYFKLGSFTPYEYLEHRYDPGVRGVVAISAFYSRTMYLGMVLYTTSKIFEGAYNWPCWFTILFVGTVGVVYTVLGGMKAVIWTDVIQFFVLFIGLTAVLFALNSRIDGGLIGAIFYTREHGHLAPQYADSGFYSITPYIRLCFWLLLWDMFIGPLNSAAADQINVQRILSTKDWKAGFKSQILSSFAAVVSSMILYLIGFAIFNYYSVNPDPVVAERGGDIAFFRFISTEMPSPLPGIFMAAMLAAIMSTLDSGMNSMATVWLKEIHGKFINRSLTPGQEVNVARCATLIVGIFAISLGLAINFCGQWLRQSVTEVGTVFYMLGAGTLPAFLTAVLTKRANARLVWCYTLWATGELIGKNVWYVLSRSARQAWESDPSAGFGWGGRLDMIWFIVPLVVGICCCIPWLLPGLRSKSAAKISALLGMLILGFSEAMGMWCFFSRRFVEDEPLARSFAFFLPLSLIAVFIVVWFCPAQPEKKWRGLTLASINDPLVK